MTDATDPQAHLNELGRHVTFFELAYVRARRLENELERQREAKQEHREGATAALEQRLQSAPTDSIATAGLYQRAKDYLEQVRAADDRVFGVIAFEASDRINRIYAQAEQDAAQAD